MPQIVESRALIRAFHVKRRRSATSTVLASETLGRPHA